LQNHVRYARVVENKEGYPVEGTHLALVEEDLASTSKPISDLTTLKNYFLTDMSEIICCVEGM
jgi:hypothetical protein